MTDVLLHAATDVLPEFTTLEVANGAAIQLLMNGQVALTISINAARHVKAPHEACRLVPGTPDAPVWWIEAWAPTGAIGDQGIAVANHFKELIHGQVFIGSAT